MVKIKVTKLETLGNEVGVLHGDVLLEFLDDVAGFRMDNWTGFHELHIGDYYVLSEAELKEISK